MFRVPRLAAEPWQHFARREPHAAFHLQRHRNPACGAVWPAGIRLGASASRPMPGETPMTPLPGRPRSAAEHWATSPVVRHKLLEGEAEPDAMGARHTDKCHADKRNTIA